MFMKYTLYVLILILTSCSGQNARQHLQIDTTKLFDPIPETSKYYSTDMFKNFVMMTQSPYSLMIQGNQIQINSNAELFKMIQIDKELVRKTKFYIIVDSSISFNNIVLVIDSIKKIGVDNYKVINYDSYFKTSSPIEFKQPTSNSKLAFDINDSSNFTITITENGYVTKILNKKEFLNSGEEIDNFIDKNKSIIDKHKIFVVSKVENPKNKMDCIVLILKKHNYTTFQIVNGNNL